MKVSSGVLATNEHLFRRMQGGSLTAHRVIYSVYFETKVGPGRDRGVNILLDFCTCITTLRLTFLYSLWGFCSLRDCMWM